MIMTSPKMEMFDLFFRVHDKFYIYISNLYFLSSDLSDYTD